MYGRFFPVYHQVYNSESINTNAVIKNFSSNSVAKMFVKL